MTDKQPQLKTRIGNFELSYENGYFKVVQYKVNAKTNKEVASSPRFYPSLDNCVNTLTREGEDHTTLVEVCTALMKDYQQKVSKAFIKDKNKIKTKEK